jgi:hypothetical protein
MKQKETVPAGRLDARACTSTYVIFCGMFGFFFALGILIGIRPGGDPTVTLASAAVFILSILWVRAFRLVIADGAISYRSLFGGTRSISATDIEKAATELNLRSGFRPPIQLIIYSTNTREDRPIRINMKVFSREDLRRVFDFLGPKPKSSRRIGLVSDDTV